MVSSVEVSTRTVASACGFLTAGAFASPFTATGFASGLGAGAGAGEGAGRGRDVQDGGAAVPIGAYAESLEFFRQQVLAGVLHRLSLIHI